jgi:hypothetical protein
MGPTADLLLGQGGDQRSTRFDHEALVGVKCAWNRDRLASHRRIRATSRGNKRMSRAVDAALPTDAGGPEGHHAIHVSRASQGGASPSRVSSSAGKPPSPAVVGPDRLPSGLR